MAGSSPKRVRKIHELGAFASNVNCAKFGKHKSGFFVTGGEDHKVHVWNLGEEEPLKTLVGHTSAVECLTLDGKDEEMLITGAANGAVKLWDLQEVKVVRTMTGHRSNCVSLDFHPFGDFFVSGSTDMSVKVWDTRRKDCIHTYKSHTRIVNCVRFSPDGRWVVSAGGDALVKLWDLTAGKLLKDFNLHRGAVNALDFHPQEFLLATGSSDRTTKFWDLETFEHIGSAGPEGNEVQKVVFTPDGKSLLAATEESVKLWGWEPIRPLDTIVVKWGTLGDVTIQDNLLLGCSVNQPKAGVWGLDLSKVALYAPDTTKRASKRLSSSATSLAHSLENALMLSPKSPPSSVNLAPRETKLSPLAGKPCCSKAEVLHHTGSCELGRHEKFLQPMPVNSNPLSNRPPAIPLRANFTTTTVSSRQKLAQPKLVTVADQPLTVSTRLSSRGRRSSVGPSDVLTSSQEGLTDTQRSIGIIDQKKRAGTTNRRRSLGFSSQGAVRNSVEVEGPVIPTAYIMPMDSNFSPVLEDHRGSSPATSPMHPAGRSNQPLLKEHVEVRVSPIASSAEPSPPRSPIKGILRQQIEIQNSAWSGGQMNGDSKANDIAAIESDESIGKSDSNDFLVEIAGINGAAQTSVEFPITLNTMDDVASVNERRQLASTPNNKFINVETLQVVEFSDAALRTSLGRVPESTVAPQSPLSASRKSQGIFEPSGDLRTEESMEDGDVGDASRLHSFSSSQVQKSSNVDLHALRSPGQGNEATPPSRTAVQSSGVLRVTTPELLSAGREDAANGALPLGIAPSRHSRSPKPGIQGGSKPLGLNVSAFLPKGGAVVGTNDHVLQEVKDEDVMEELMEEHQAMNIILQGRLANLQAVKSFWLKDNVRGTLEMMERTDDPSVVVDVLSVIAMHSGIFTLEGCVVLLPLLGELLCSPHDRYVTTGLSILSELLKNFSDLIRDSRMASPSPGVDIEAEQRRDRCTACYSGFQALYNNLSLIIRKGGIIGKDAKRCSDAIEKL